ncbi:hypothetical protein H6P81_002755 [Aristolochia fimbriata]|uniref:FAR1 domain-containing protein n=1 Tax=Aristolochia fimbriata TaxID=158543 RepID=A0AAV7FDV6_ARIFI|nr:hypothetical protein H6P81_002755 [Aristolochia fimbriata]
MVENMQKRSGKVIGQFNLGFIIEKLDSDLFIMDQCLLMDLPKTPLVDRGSSTSTYVPRAVQDGVPKIGMSFESVKDVEVFYNAYAKEAGFSVRKGSECKNSLTKELYSKLFICSKQGKPNNGKGILDPVKKRRRGVVRENCEAALRVFKSKDEKWVVVKFIEEHSQILATPRKVPFLPSHREVTSAQKSLISMFREADISTSQIMSFLEIQSGGSQNIRCTSRDIRNVERDIRMEKKDYDAELLIEHFKESQEINPSFFYRYEVDDNHKLTHCFWVDGWARKAYHHFGDVVVFILLTIPINIVLYLHHFLESIITDKQ